MQITFINDFANGPRQFTAQEIASFQRDELAAETMFESTFTNNISLTFNVGFGSYQGQNLTPYRTAWGVLRPGHRCGGAQHSQCG